MKLPIIGITARVISNDYKEISKVPVPILNYILKYNAIPIIIPIMDNDKLLEIIDIFDGFIIPGGETFTKMDHEIIKYATNNNKPLLGICAGMQAIGCIKYYGYDKPDQTTKIENDTHANVTHYININDSLLKDILGNNRIQVNSRHHDKVLNDPSFIIDAISDDGIIEAIHLPNTKFVYGVQWHPEDLENEYSKRLFEYFINECKEKEK